VNYTYTTTTSSTNFGVVLLVALIVDVCLYAFMFWGMFKKAGHPGWASIVPIYNLIVLIQVAKKEIWWIVLFLIPIVNIIAFILIDIAVAENFGKSGGFAVGLIFLPFIFFPILSWGSAQYMGGGASAMPPAPPMPGPPAMPPPA
jgi:hypothetical protein